MPSTIKLHDPRADALRVRVMNAIPAHQYAFDTLLRLCEVTVSETVETAAVRCGAAPALFVNPRFVETWCRSDEALFMLIMHELHHILLGHTRLFPRATPTHNFAFDAVINAYLSHLFPQPAHLALFRSYYPAADPMRFLLRPPDGWPTSPRWNAPTAGGAPPTRCALHRRLYSDAGIGYDELFQALAEDCAPELTIAGVPLLGDHARPDTDDWGTGQPDRAVLVEVIRQIVERWPPPEGARRGRSLQTTIQRSLVPPAAAPPSVVAVLRRALQHAVSGHQGALPRRGTTSPLPYYTPLPDPRDRRGIVARAIGREPLYYASELAGSHRQDGGCAHLYLDVSGSMVGMLPHLYAALQPFRGALHPQVHLFSTQLRDIPITQLARRVRLTDGGTDIAAVVDHVLAHRITRAAIVTDGYVGAVPAADQALLQQRGVRLTVALTPNGWEEDLAPVASRIFHVPQWEVYR